MSYKSFTLIEIIIVIVIVSTLLLIVIFAINPGERMARARDDQREIHLNAILHAVEQKMFLDKGWLNCDPLPTQPKTIGSHTDEYNLYSCIIPEFLSTPVFDPKFGYFVSLSDYYTNYQIWHNPSTGKVSLRVAPNGQGETRAIQVGE